MKELIIRVRDLLLKQGCKAGFVDSRFVCQFLDDKGNRCAIGHLLTEEQCKYLQGPCNDSWDKFFPEEQRDILDRLRRIHDFEEPSNWRAAFERLLNETGQ